MFQRLVFFLVLLSLNREGFGFVFVIKCFLADNIPVRQRYGCFNSANKEETL